MLHDFHLEGHAFRLRPVTLEDAEFIVEVRTSDVERSRYLNPISSDVGCQRDWLNAYFQRENDYYWVIENQRSQRHDGLVGIYNVQPQQRKAEWGRWVLRPGSLAAVESALLVYRAAFELLNLDSVYCLTVAGNAPVVSFHDSCGLHRAGLLKNHLQIGAHSHDAVQHTCDRQTWTLVHQKLEPQAVAIARRFTVPA
jgi:RimJ/RimL family protein N-acetyltransferase